MAVYPVDGLADSVVVRSATVAYVTRRDGDTGALVLTWQRRCHNAGMTVAITIRNVPDDVRDELAARAARSGRSLQEYVLRQLVDIATRPSADDVIARARARARVTGTQLDSRQILAARDADRR